jgi:adenylate cyclase
VSEDPTDASDATDAVSMPEQTRAAGRRVRSTARALNANERLLGVTRRARQLLPGDSDFGDRLSTAGRGQPEIAGRTLSALTSDEPNVLREAGLGALQVWQALLENTGRGRGDRELTIVFTDLAGFSTWALQAGDDDTLSMLRMVSEIIEPAVVRHRGRVLKRLGDGMMATFTRPQAAYDAIQSAREGLEPIEVAGYRPLLRAGLHTGLPKKISDDYVGVDVNVAARLAEKAGPGETLVSEATLRELDPERITFRRKKTFAFTRVKGVPSDLVVYAVSPR